MLGAAMLRSHVNHRPLKPGAAVDRLKMPAFDVRPMSGLLLSPHRSRRVVQRYLRLAINLRPWTAIEVRGLLVHAPESIGHQPGAVVFLPDDILREFPTLFEEFLGVKHESQER